MAQLSLICFLVATLFAGQSLAQYNQKAVLYSGSKCTGSFITVTDQYVSDLRTLGWDNYAYSAAITGTWNFYDYVDYNHGTDALMEYSFGPNQYCIDFNNLRGKVTSMRFSGSPRDYRSSTLTLYKGTYFQENEEYIISNVPNVVLTNHASFIITGTAAWTLYDRPNYQGNSLCVYPPDSNNYTPAFVFDTNSVDVPHDTIRSVRAGCVGKRRVRLPLSTHGESPVSVQTVDVEKA